MGVDEFRLKGERRFQDAHRFPDPPFSQQCAAERIVDRRRTGDAGGRLLQMRDGGARPPRLQRDDAKKM